MDKLAVEQRHAAELGTRKMSFMLKTRVPRARRKGRSLKAKCLFIVKVKKSIFFCFQCHATDPTIRTTVILSGGEVWYSCGYEDHRFELLILSGNRSNACYNVTLKILKVTPVQGLSWWSTDIPAKYRGVRVVFAVNDDGSNFSCVFINSWTLTWTFLHRVFSCFVIEFYPIFTRI